MEIIQDIEGLLKLNTGDDFYVIQRGLLKSYVFCMEHPLNSSKYDASSKRIVAVEKFDFTVAMVFSKHSFSGSIFLKGKYISSEAGTIMANQLSEEIDTIRSVYVH